MELLKKYFKKIINLLWEDRNWIKASTIIFLISIFLGVITFLWRDLPTFKIISSIASEMEKLGDKAKHLDFLGRFFLIYKENFSSLTLMLFWGIIFGIVPFLALLVNGLFLGFLFITVILLDISTFQKTVTLFSLIPHGIIELPIFIISASWGLKLGLEFLMPQSSGKRLHIFIDNLKKAFWIFLLMGFGLALAAFIEVLDMKVVEILVR